MNKLLNNLYWKGRMAFYRLTREEDGAVDIVAIAVMIGIVVVVALIFKDGIIKLITDLFNNIDTGDIDNKPDVQWQDHPK